MSSPRLGVVRESMLSNPLLIKAPLGRSRTLPGLPGPDFKFGAVSSLKDGGVAEVLSSWKVQSSHQECVRRIDFVSLNRDAVKSGLVTSKELSQYRAQRGGATAQSSTHKPLGGGPSRRPTAVPDITFGVRNRAPSPLSDLLSYQYARRWLDQQLSRTPTIDRTHKVKAGCVAETRTSLLRRSKSLPVTQKPFTLRQYTQVAPALDTFRDQKNRLRAFEAHQRDSVSTRGPQGQPKDGPNGPKVC